MRMDINVRVDPALQTGLRNHPRIVQTNVWAGLDAAGLYVVGVAQENATTFPRVRTGRLRRSIQSRRTSNVVQIGSNVVYARIQELGGTIRPRRARFLRFQVNGRWVAVRQVSIRAKRYLQRALENSKQEVEQIMNRALERAVRECGFE